MGCFEYIARRGSAKFKQEHLMEARCNILGYVLDSLKVEGNTLEKPSFSQKDSKK